MASSASKRGRWIPVSLAKGHVFGPRGRSGRVRLGQCFGRLCVREAAPPARSGAKRWECSCSCGGTTVAVAYDLVSGHARSCGCISRDRTIGRNTTHGGSKRPEYAVWLRLVHRCVDPRAAAYPYYGGRGIRVCASWRRSFESFFAVVGPRPSSRHEIERIDNDGDYAPGNVRWATDLEQANNRRSNRWVTAHGETLTVAQWERRTGTSRWCIYARLNRGWLGERAVFGGT